MSSRVKTSAIQARPFNQSGQAVIEYVLMLVISVSLVVLLATQIFTPFQNFLKAYIGDYVQCLLEVGELPSLGGEDTRVADEGCNAKFEAASISDGRPSKGSGSSGSNGDSGSGSDSSNSSKSSRSSSDSSGSSGSGGKNAGSSSRSGGRSTMLSKNGPGGMDGASGGSGKTTEIPLEQGAGSSSGFFTTGNNQVIYVRRTDKTTSIGIAGLTDAERKKLEKKDIANKQRTVASDGEGGPAPKKLVVKPPEAKTTLAQEGTGWSIGNFIRYLFIACIIIVILIFIGGQALQMSKSMEK